MFRNAIMKINIIRTACEQTSKEVSTISASTEAVGGS